MKSHQKYDLAEEEDLEEAQVDVKNPQSKQQSQSQSAFFYNTLVILLECIARTRFHKCDQSVFFQNWRMPQIWQRTNQKIKTNKRMPAFFVYFPSIIILSQRMA